MRLSMSEQEIVIRVALDEDDVTITGAGGYWCRFIQRLAKRTGRIPELLSPDALQLKISRDRVNLAVPKRQATRSPAQQAHILKLHCKHPTLHVVSNTENSE
jgi:hypothetical protein